MPSSRRYSETEIGALIQRATELHASAESRESDLSMEDVERIATDLGIPAQYVRTAAVEMATGREMVSEDTISGAPFRLRIAELLDGEIDDDTWADMVMELRRSVSASGKAEEIGSMKEWKAVFEDMGMTLSGTHVVVRNKDGQSTLELERFYGGVASFSYVMAAVIGWTMTGMILSSMGLDKWLIVMIAGTGGIGGLAAVRAGIGFWSRSRRRKLQDLAARLRRLASSVSHRSNDQAFTQALEQSTEPAIRVSDDGLDISFEEDSVEAPNSPGRTRDHS